MTRSRLFILFFAILAAAALLSGCGSDTKEGAAQTTTTTTPAEPGNLSAAITGVAVSGPPVVTFTLRDENGSALDPDSVIASGGRVRFTIAKLDIDGYYKNYILSSTGAPTFDSGGTFDTVGDGVYTYTFKTDITANSMYNAALTHTIAAQIERDISSAVGTEFQQAVNPYLNFRPDGGAVALTREVVAVSNCNVCHGKLNVHGGGRREVALCILCHYPGVTDPDSGNSVDFKSMVHKIHMGKKLPSNVAGGDYTIIGFNDTPFSFKNVGFPFMSGDSFIDRTPIRCVKCHTRGTDLAGRTYGNDVDKWKAAPKIATCTTCHDTTVFDGSTTVTVGQSTVPASAHTGGQASDGSCSACHNDDSEYAAVGSAIGAHTILEESSVFTGLNFQIISVSGATAGSAPTVRFRITDNAGNAIAPNLSGASFSLKLGYPASEYTNNGMSDYGQPLSQSLTDATSNGDGSYTITFSTAIPASASGVGVIGMEGRASYTVTTGHKGTQSFRVGGQAIQYFFDMATGGQVTDTARQRRLVVDVNKCLSCHNRLTLHGANRVDSSGECVICHNPNATDRGRRPTDPTTTEDGLAERSIHFKVMIHSIHTGEELESQPYVIYGYGGSANDFSEIRFPRDRRDCLACHIDAEPKTFGLPLPDGVLGTTTSTGTLTNDDSDNTRTLPATAACTSCHDGAIATGHAESKVVSGVETCTQCHTTGLLLGADLAHTPER